MDHQPGRARHEEQGEKHPQGDRVHRRAEPHQPHGFTAFTRFDITYLIRYPTRAAADPDNLAPTLKPIIDGCTRAGLWPDDSSKYMRSRTYRQSTRTSGQRGIWAIEIHITPLTEEES